MGAGPRPDASALVIRATALCVLAHALVHVRAQRHLPRLRRPPLFHQRFRALERFLRLSWARLLLCARGRFSVWQRREMRMCWKVTCTFTALSLPRMLRPALVMRAACHC